MIRGKNIKAQQEYCDKIQAKGQSIIDMKKLGDVGKKELS
jgi:hypothetical protein